MMKIIEFSVANYKSFKELNTLSMLAQPIKPRFDWLSTNIFQVDEKLSLLKSKAILGSNASGKSNLVLAFSQFIGMVHLSVKNDDVIKNNEPFILSLSTLTKPSYFQLIFLLDGVKYRYGFEANQKRVFSEWLFGDNLGREVTYFIRDGETIHSKNKRRFPEANQFGTFMNEDNQIVRPNALFLTAAAALNGKISKTIVDAISDIIVIDGKDNQFTSQMAYEYIKEKENKEKVLQFINDAGIKIKDLSLKDFDFSSVDASVTKMKTLTATRDSFDENGRSVGIISWLMSKNESDGTQKMVHISPFIITALEEGNPIIIDEFEAKLHTNLTKKIIETFNSNELNPHQAQFIFATHDSNVLSSKLLRRDQICFVDKNEFQESSIYSLSDIKGVRNDENYEKNYLLGKYGAVERIGDLDFVN